MNRYYSAIVAILTGITISASAQTAPPSVLLPSHNEIVRLRALEPEKAKKAEQNLLDSRARFGLDFDHTFQHRTSFTDRYGNYHGRFRQLYKGVRVFGSTALAHLDRAGQARPTTQKLYRGIAIGVIPKISQVEASALALTAFDPRGAMPKKEAVQIELVVMPNLEKFPNPPGPDGAPGRDSLGRPYTENARSFQLAWSLTAVSADSGENPIDYLIDAQTGRILRSNRGASDTEAAKGKGNSWFHGPVDINTSKKSPTEFFLTDRLRGSDGGNIIRNAKHKSGKSDVWFDHFYNTDNLKWGNGAKYKEGDGSSSSQGQTAAVDVAWNFERTWDMLANVFDRNGLNGSGRYLDAAIHWNTEYNDAKYIYYYQRAFFGEGNTSTSLRTTAHELGHGLYDNVVGTPKNESIIAAGINEGHADIMGTLSEYYAFGIAGGKGGTLHDTEADWNWDSRMINPYGYSAGEGFIGLRYHPEEWKPYHEEEHVIGCLYGHMFIFLAHGAPRGIWGNISQDETASPLYSRFLPEGMSGIGVQGAADIWYQATVTHLVENPDFYDLRNAYSLAVNDMYDSPYWWKTAVLAAFHGIGIPSLTGEILKDKEIPSNLWIKVDSIDQSEGILLAHADGRDNILLSRVEFSVDNKAVFSDYRLPYGGPIDTSALTPGSHTLKATFFDLNGNSQAIHDSFIVAGRIQIAANGGFESGSTGWGANNAVDFRNDAASFTGSRYASLKPGAQLWQDIAIPATAESAALSYRVRVESHINSGHLGEFLLVQIRDIKQPGGATVANYASHMNTAGGVFWRNYIRGAMDVSAYRGKTVRILFENPWPSGNERFKVDHVRLTITEGKKLTGTATVNSAEKTVEFALTQLTGIPADQIDRVTYTTGEKTAISKSGMPFRVVMSVKGLPPGQHSVTARVYNHENQVMVQATSSFKIEAVNELLVNGDFEAGVSPWFGPGLFTVENLLQETSHGFMSNGNLLLGGEGFKHTSAVRQAVKIPQNAKSAKLTFRLSVDTQEAPGVVADLLSANLLREGSDLVLRTFNNTLNTKGPSSWDSYITIAVDIPIAGLHGKSVYVDFVVMENTGCKKTWFLLDR
ncbi:MAG: hypothetical protein H7Y20_15335, partial [Bryobacteraceae bacterium]|nr:hypothetical protein [Bryobacteraceae bacterium]